MNDIINKFILFKSLWNIRANDKILSSMSYSLGMQLPSRFNEETGRRKSCLLCGLQKISFASARQNGCGIKNREINVECRTDGQFERNVTVRNSAIIPGTEKKKK